LNLFTTVFCTIMGVDDFFQAVLKMSAIGISTMSHTMDRVLDEGSKMENRLVIIFIVYLLFLLVWAK